MDTERKSYKRETAVALLIFVCGMFVWGAGWSNEVATESAKYLSVPVFAFTFGAFGIEGLRQLHIGGKA